MSRMSENVINAVFFLIGIGLLLAGFFARHWVLRKRFERRNGAGLEIFPTYWSSVRAHAFERVVNAAAVGLRILGGLFALAAAVGVFLSKQPLGPQAQSDSRRHGQAASRLSDGGSRSAEPAKPSSAERPRHRRIPK